MKRAPERHAARRRLRRARLDAFRRRSGAAGMFEVTRVLGEAVTAVLAPAAAAFRTLAQDFRRDLALVGVEFAAAARPTCKPVEVPGRRHDPQRRRDGALPTCPWCGSLNVQVFLHRAECQEPGCRHDGPAYGFRVAGVPAAMAARAGSR